MHPHGYQLSLLNHFQTGQDSSLTNSAFLYIFFTLLLTKLPTHPLCFVMFLHIFFTFSQNMLLKRKMIQCMQVKQNHVQRYLSNNCNNRACDPNFAQINWEIPKWIRGGKKLHQLSHDKKVLKNVQIWLAAISIHSMSSVSRLLCLCCLSTNKRIQNWTHPLDINES